LQDGYRFWAKNQRKNKKNLMIRKTERFLYWFSSKKASKNSNRGKKRKTKLELDAEKAKNILKEVDQPLTFYLNDGTHLKSLNDLAIALKKMDNKVYTHHINEFKHDFHNWIKDVFADEHLASKIKNVKNRKTMHNQIRGRISELQEILKIKKAIGISTAGKLAKKAKIKPKKASVKADDTFINKPEIQTVKEILKQKKKAETKKATKVKKVKKLPKKITVKVKKTKVKVDNLEEIAKKLKKPKKKNKSAALRRKLLSKS
jgi:ferritin-like metal-binding protein YciE